MEMTRNEVYDAIDSERDYQNSFVKESEYETIHPVSAELVMMKSYLDKAFDAWTNNKGEVAALHQMRKVVAMGIRCFENHGVPDRFVEKNFAE